MRFQAAHLAVLLAVVVPACSNERKAPGHPQITPAQIEKDAETSLPRDGRLGPDGPYEEGKIEVLESSYSGDSATIVLTMGNVRVGSLVPDNVDLKTGPRPKMASTDVIPWKLRLDYEWHRGEWRLRQLDNLTFEVK